MPKEEARQKRPCERSLPLAGEDSTGLKGCQRRVLVQMTSERFAYFTVWPSIPQLPVSQWRLFQGFVPKSNLFPRNKPISRHEREGFRDLFGAGDSGVHVSPQSLASKGTEAHEFIRKPLPLVSPSPLARALLQKGIKRQKRAFPPTRPVGF